MTSDPFEETADAGTGTSAPVALAPGAFLGKYRLDRVLGEGGMGVVWAAHDPDLERAVAIKVLRYAQASQQLRQRLLREARAMAKLKHPNVLTVYEVGTVGDRDYIAMELVDGMTLDGWLALEPTAEERWSAVLAAGRGLAAAHNAGVIHRDFKPHNVLRSREGRILVTDFGLARGMLAEQDVAALGDDSHDAGDPHSSPVLDALTQTGALIGTPAYMAPEQYSGASPDPRTDQFAFCVTAWQALTGERPFSGTSLEEMRRSASRGVAHIATKLPRALRGVLARGLDPDAANRWPSMEALLDELERAHDAPRRQRVRWAWAIAAVLVALGVALAIFSDRSAKRPTTSCDDPDGQFDEAWSPAVRGALARKADEPTLARIGDQLDRYSERWIESYAKACRARPAKLARQRLACLEGLRDHAAAITAMLVDVDVHAFEPRDGLRPIASCDAQTPIAPPRVPRDQPRRDRILRVMGRGLALRGTPADVAASVEALLAEATQLAWQPLAPLILVSAAGEYLRAGSPALARTTYERAIASLPADAELRDMRIEGSAYLGLLDASLVELADPHAAVPSGVRDAKAKAPLHGELAVRITKATNAAGSDPLMLGTRSVLAARAYAHAAQWNRYASGYEDALRLTAEARKQFEELGDVQRVAYAAAIEAHIYLMRGDDRALDDALFAARRAQDALEAAKLPRLAALDDIRATVAFERRDYGELYRIQKAQGRTEPVRASGQLVAGRVIGDNVGFATVVAWQTDVVGHARSIVMDPSTLAGSIAHVQPDGTFQIHAGPDWAIMVEKSGTRSTPRLVGSGPLTLKLEPAVTISGQLQGRNWFGVKVFARYTAGDRRWTLQAPVDKDGTFDLRGLPPGPRVYGTEGPAGTGTRTIVAGTSPKQISWSYGQAVEIIVRGTPGPDARAWLIRGKHAIGSREQLAALVATAPDVASSGLEPVGANNTDAGRDVYRAGDRHAVITGNYAGQYYTACAVADGPPRCTTVTIENTVAIEYPDGRFGGGVTPILLEL